MAEVEGETERGGGRLCLKNSLLGKVLGISHVITNHPKTHV